MPHGGDAADGSPTNRVVHWSLASRRMALLASCALLYARWGSVSSPVWPIAALIPPNLARNSPTGLSIYEM